MTSTASERAATPPVPEPLPTLDPTIATTLCGIFFSDPYGGVTVFENGQAIGFRMYGVHRNEAALVLGLQNGDVVVEVNGVGRGEIGSMRTSLRDLTSCTDLRITVKRGDRLVQLE